MKWYDALPGVRGAELLRDDLLAHWPDRAFDDRLCRLQFCPVVLTEIYQVARHYPLSVIEGGTGPMVVIDLRPDVLLRPAFTEDGALAGAYRPFVTRLLPFFCEPGVGPMRLIDDLAQAGPERPEGLRSQVREALLAQQAGQFRLQGAARLALARGLLRPEAGLAQPGPRLWRASAGPVDHAEFGLGSGEQMDPASLAELALAMRLVAVMEFSERHRRADGAVALPQGAARDLLRRDDALRDQTFLSDGGLVDFTQLQAGTTDVPFEG